MYFTKTNVLRRGWKCQCHILGSTVHCSVKMGSTPRCLVSHFTFWSEYFKFCHPKRSVVLVLPVQRNPCFSEVLKQKQGLTWLGPWHLESCELSFSCHPYILYTHLFCWDVLGSLPCMETAAELLFRYVLPLRACALSSTTSNEGGESAAVVLMQNL